MKLNIAVAITGLLLASCDNFNEPKKVCAERGPTYQVPSRFGYVEASDCIRKELRCTKPLELYTDPDGDIKCKLPNKVQ